MAGVATLRDTELDAAAELLGREGWMFTTRELARVMATGPGLSVAARGPASIIGLVMVARHGDLAWVGNVVVDAPHRGRGLGEAMMRGALERIAAAGARTTKLCSVPQAETLYARLGFHAEGIIRTFGKVHERPAHRPPEAELLAADALPEVLALDRAAFGADRSGLLGLLLRDHPMTGVGVRDARGALRGYAFLKAGDRSSELGPVVARDRAAAEMLLDGALAFRLQGEAAELECSVPEPHPWMHDLLRARGFFAQDWTKTLMWHGRPLPQDWVACAALAGLEKG